MTNCSDDLCLRYAQSTDCVQNCDYCYAHIGEDGCPHSGNSHCAERQDQSLDTEGEYDVLMNDA